MITRIDATNYRCFEGLGVPLSELCIIAGANGSGKTTLLDVPVLLGDLLRSRNLAGAFMERVLDRGARAISLSEIPFRAHCESFSIGVEASLPDTIRKSLVAEAPSAVQRDAAKWPTHIRYELRLQVDEAHARAAGASSSGERMAPRRSFVPRPGARRSARRRSTTL